MRVRVYVPPFGDSSEVDERGFVDLAEGTTLDGLLRKLRMPLRRFAAVFCVVNYNRASSGTVLKDGDVVSFFSILAGG